MILRILKPALLFFLMVGWVSEASRLKDIASLKGVRDNQLLGYGIVIGLSGTGDKSSELTENSLSLALKSLGVDLKSKLETKNTAAVICSATLPAFARAGSRIHITVSGIGSATSLEGGTLLMTSMRGPDGQVYAMAQGKLTVAKRGDNKAAGQTLVTAEVPSGGILEKEVSFDFSSQKQLRYYLHAPDFTTAARVARRINEELGGKYATAADAGTIDVILPYHLEVTPVELIAQLERIDIEADRRAKIVLNPRTGTVVMGDEVRVLPVAVAHNNLQIEVAKNSSGESKHKKVMVMNQATNIADLVGTLNEMGASGDDLIALVQTLRAAGAIAAEVEIQ